MTALVNQATFADNAGVSSFGVTVPSTTAGNLLVLCIGTKDGVDFATSISGGGTWTKAIDAGTTGLASQAAEIWYCENSSAGTTLVSVTLNGNSRVVAWFGEFSGLATASAFTASNAAIGTSANPSPGSITPTQATGLAIGFTQFANTSTTVSSGPTGWTRPSSGNVESAAASGSGTELDVAYLIDPGTSATTPTWTINASRGWGAAVAFFKEASSGATNYNGTATQSATATITAAGVVGSSAGASVAATATITAAGSVTSGLATGASLGATGAISSAGVVGTLASATLSATGAISAAAVVGVRTSASISATSSVTAAGVVGATAGSSLSATATITAAGAVTTGPSASASISATAVITAAGVVGKFAGATLAATASIAAVGKATALRYFFSPPTHEEPIRVGVDMPSRPLSYFRMTYAASVVKVGGTYRSVRTPSAESLVGLVEGVDFFRGGYEYEVDHTTALALAADGYSTTLI